MRTFAITVVAILAAALPFSGAVLASDIATAELLRRDFSAAAELLEDAAERGDSEAQYRLAGLVRRGFVPGRQESEAAELYGRAATEGFTLAALAEPKTARFDWPQFASDQQLIALIWAAGRGDLDELDDLIGTGVDVNRRSISGSTALIQAARNGHPAIVTRLLDASASINATDVVGDTPLIHAVSAGHADVARILIERGAEIDQTGLFGNSPILIATKRQHLDIVQDLLAAGADVSLANASNQTATQIAALSRSEDVARALGVTQPSRAASSSTAHLQLDQVNRDGRAIWFVAADRGDIRAINKLLESGAAVDQVDENQRTALTIAAERGHLALVTRLLQVGASPVLSDATGNTAIVAAAALDRSDVLIALLGSASSSVSASSSEPAIAAAIETGADRNLVLLLNAGFTPSTNAPFPALMHATQVCRPAAIRTLVDELLDPDITDPAGRTPAWFAASNACAEGLVLLRGAGADLSKADRDGVTPLHRAAMTSCTDCVEELLSARVTPDPRDRHGWTPLMLAATHHQFGNLQALATAGHDIDAANSAGNTALLVSVQRGDATAVEKLLRLGAKKRIVNKERQNAADVAKSFGHDGVTSLLRSF